MTEAQAILEMNQMGVEGRPFLVVVDFDKHMPMVMPLPIDSGLILYDFNGVTNAESSTLQYPDKIHFAKQPVSFETYLKGFNVVKNHIHNGNSYLVNYTQPTAIQTNLDLKTIFYLSKARYKLWINNQFVCFSPESFIKIEDGVITSYPMKGTIDACLPNAHQQLLADEKEKAEHATIVDLIRNDLSKVAQQVQVENYRYIEQVDTLNGPLLQVSSKISGQLAPGCNQQLGTILFSLLPAGSITGAPKCKTVSIIKEAEGYKRGFYTGIFGLFDGKKFDSSVLIRFIEQGPNGLVYKSGGGITAQSDPEKEYRELIDKVYVPIY